MTFIEYLKIIWQSWGFIIVLILIGLIALYFEEKKPSPTDLESFIINRILNGEEK